MEKAKRFIQSLFIAGLMLTSSNVFAHDLITPFQTNNLIEVDRIIHYTNININDPLDNEGNTPLMIAASGGYTEMVQMLIYAGANVTLLNKNGQDALGLAVEKGSLATINIISKASDSPRPRKRKR